jgi:hypothetical protein
MRSSLHVPRIEEGSSVKAAEVGCTPHEIAAITGHASLKEIERYTRTADRRRLAISAMEKAKAGTASVKPAPESECQTRT